MIKGRDIICHALPTWEGDYMKAVVQLMAQFAKYNRVIYVNYAYTYKDLIQGMMGKNKAPVRKILGSGGRLESKLKAENGELFLLYPPPVLPTNWIKKDSAYRYWQHKESLKVGKSINEAQSHLGFKNPILINAFNPQFGLGLLGNLNEALSIYYCYDEINAAAWCKEHGKVIEDDFLQRVDAVVCTSESLKNNKGKRNPNTFLVKNGVDHALFQKAIKSNTEDRKVIGYIGSIDDRLDYDLLAKIAKEYAEHRLKLIGRITYEGAHDFAGRFQNVELTGAKQPNELVEELREVDLGLIPFVTNEFTKNVYPLKVNEYLAAGKAVVSTEFADLSEFIDQIAIASNADAFLKGVEEALRHDSLSARKERSQWARQNSWEHRAEQFSQVIETIQEKQHAKV